MIGANCKITTYRLLKTGSKESYSSFPILAGVPAHLQRESLELASFIDQENVHEVYRIEFDSETDVQRGDKVQDDRSVTYIVHNVSKTSDPEFGSMTSVIVKLKR